MMTPEDWLVRNVRDWVIQNTDFGALDFEDKNVEISPKGIIVPHRDFLLTGTFEKIPHKFCLSLDHSVTINCSNLTSLDGLPSMMLLPAFNKISLNIEDADLPDLKTFPKKISGDIRIYGTAVRSLRGIEDLNFTGHVDLTYAGVVSGMMSVFYSDTLGGPREIFQTNSKVANYAAARIINEFFSGSRRRNSDILECHDMLLEAGLEEYC